MDETAVPLPKSPISLNGELLHEGGWQIAVMAAEPGKVGVMMLLKAGMVVGEVD